MLLERDDQLQALQAHLDAARDGRGSFVLLGGEAGAGKSSLVRAFVDRLPHTVELCQGGCDPLTTPRPLSPLRDHAAAPTGPLAGLDIDDGAAVFQAVLDRLSGSGTAVMVIEDLHWADQATLDFVTYLARRVGTTNTLVVATYRDDEIGVDHPARAVLGHIAALDSSERIAVPALTIDAVAAVAEGSGIDARELHRTTAGNAFFVTEVLASGSALPETVQDAVLARVGRLTDGQRQVVRTVSIAPRSLDIETTQHVAGCEADDIDTAVTAGVLLDDGGRLRFRHELARAAIEQSIPPARCQSMHSAMLATLLDGAEPDHALLAHHAIRARSPELIVEHAPAAAEEARSRSAIREAVAFVRAALAHDGLIGDDRSAHLRLELAHDLAALDEATESIDVARNAERHFRAAGDARNEARSLLTIGGGLNRVGYAGESESAYDDAIRLLEPLGPSDDLARALSLRASAAMLARQVGSGIATATRALEIAEIAGTPTTQRSIRHILACLELVGGDTDRGLELLQASVAEVADDPLRRGTALVNLGTGAGEVRRYGVATEALESAAAHCAAHDLDESATYVRSWCARVEFEQGRWDAAVAHAEHVDRTAVNRAGYGLLTAHGALGRVRVRRGDPNGRSLLEHALAEASGHNLQYVWPVVSGVAESLWLSDDADLLVDIVTPWFEAAVGTDSAWAKGELGFWMWRGGSLESPPDGAAEPFVRQIDGDWAGAAAAWRSIGCPYEVGLALADGDTDARLEAVRIFDELGAKPMADRTRSALRDDGVEGVPRGPATVTREHPLGLTGRQGEVLALIVDGLSNSEIAARLFVSKKTVEHHVSAVYAKLGVTTRAQAIAAAHPA